MGAFTGCFTEYNASTKELENDEGKRRKKKMVNKVGKDPCRVTVNEYSTAHRLAKLKKQHGHRPQGTMREGRTGRRKLLSQEGAIRDSNQKKRKVPR